MAILSLGVLMCLLIVAATSPISIGVSNFEASRREKAGLLSDLDVSRARYFNNIIIIRRLKSAVLLVLFVPSAIAAFGWLAGVLISVVVALGYRAVAKFGPLQFLAAKLYRLYEPYLLNLCKKATLFFKFFPASEQTQIDRQLIRLGSKDELLAVVKNSPNILSDFEDDLLKNALNFESAQVEDIMTPKSMIDSIDHRELLGPITLSELHKTGHSRFPVTDGDIDHIVGVLYARNLLTVDGSKNSKKVNQVMDKEVCFIRQDQTLGEALVAFFKTQKLLFVVINEFRETVGIVTLEDVIETLIGQKINDEFEQHSSLRAVAERNPRKNNSPAQAKDI